jgi:hypothetical protein
MTYIGIPKYFNHKILEVKVKRGDFITSLSWYIYGNVFRKND